MRLTAGVAICAVVALQAQTVDQIVARNIKARGGAARLAALKTQSLTGTLAFAAFPGEPFHVEMKKPGKMRQEITVADEKDILVIDGTQGFTLHEGNPVKPVPADRLEALVGSADVEGPLFSYKSKGHRIELQGKELVNSRNAYKLLITLKDRSECTYYIDAQTYQKVKVEARVGAMKTESYFRDYREIEGLSFPFEIDSSGPNFKQKLIFTRIEVNIDLPDSRFTKP